MSQVAKLIRIIYKSLVYLTENTSHTCFEVNLTNDVQGNYHSFLLGTNQKLTNIFSGQNVEFVDVNTTVY